MYRFLLAASIAVRVAVLPAHALEDKVSATANVWFDPGGDSFYFWFRNDKIHIASTTTINTRLDPQDYRPLAVPKTGGSVCRDLPPVDKSPRENRRRGSICVTAAAVGEDAWTFNFHTKESGTIFGVKLPDEDEDVTFTLTIAAESCVLTGVKVLEHGKPHPLPRPECVGDARPDNVGVENSDLLFEVN
jgi:hypothetical protein